MFIIPILLIFLLVAKLWTIYGVPFLIQSEGLLFYEEYILPAITADVQFWQVFTLCLIIALITGLPFEVNFSKNTSRLYQQVWFFTKMNNESTQVVLEIAKDRNGYITAADLAGQSDVFTLSSAGKILSDLQKRGFIDLSVTPSGEILYYFPGFDQREAVQQEDHKSDEKEIAKMMTTRGGEHGFGQEL